MSRVNGTYKPMNHQNKDQVKRPPFSRKPEMTDESGKQYRDVLLASGQVTPGTVEFDQWGMPYLSEASMRRLRQRLISSGLIDPIQPLAEAYAPKLLEITPEEQEAA